MKIKIENKEYNIDLKKAKSLGLVKEIKPPIIVRQITVDSDEAAVLNVILGHVGGSPYTARGKAESIHFKLNQAFPNFKTDLDLSINSNLKGAIYFVN